MSVLPRTTVRKRSRLLAAALLPFMLLVAACKTDTTIEYKADGTSVSSIVVEDDEGKLSGRNLTCQSAIAQLQRAGQGRSSAGLDLNKVKVEDLSNGGNLKCKLTQTQTRQESGLAKTSDGYVLKVPANPRLNSSSFRGQVKVTFKLVMPGKITKASGNGKISGNTVTYEGLDIMSQGAEIRAAKGEGSDDEPSASENGTAADPVAGASKNDSDGGFPMWAWFAIGGGAVVLLGLIIFLATRKGKGSGSGQAYTAPFGGPQAPQQFGQPQAPQQFGQPQAPQQFGQPQAPQQFGQPQAPQQFSGPQAPQQFGQPQAPQQFGGPQNQQGYSQHPPQQGGGYPQNPPQQGGY